MANVGELVIQLSANVARLQKDMAKSTRLVEGAGKKMQSTISSVKTAFAALGVGVSAAAFGSFVKNTADAADQLGKLSQKVGVSVEQLSALQYAGKLSDVSMDQLGTGLRMLSKNLYDTQAGTGEAKDAFAAMGISVQDASGRLKSSDAVLREVADRFAAMEDGAGKTALVMRIFGESGAHLIPLLNQGSRGLDEMTGEAERLGVVISTKTSKAAEKFNDDLTRLNSQLEGMRLSVGGPLIESLGNLTEELIEGQKAAGGFWAAIQNLGTINPFKDTGANLAAINAELAQLKGNSLSAVLASDGTMDPTARIRRLETQRSYLLAQQRSQALAGTAGQILDPRDAMARQSTKVAAPAMANRTQAAAAAAAAKDAERAARAARDKERAEAITHGDEMVDLYESHLMDQYRDAVRHGDEMVDLFERNRQDEIDIAIRTGDDMVARWNQNQDELANTGRRAAEEMKAAFEGFGRDTSRTFAETLTSGENMFDGLRDAGRMFFTELIERILYTQAIAPALDWASAAFDGFITGGGKAFGGAVNPGMAYPVGENGMEMFVPNVPGDIVPMGAGGGVTLVQTNYIDSRSDLQSVMGAVKMAGDRAKSDIMRSMQRNGAFAKATA